MDNNDEPGGDSEAQEEADDDSGNRNNGSDPLGKSHDSEPNDKAKSQKGDEK